MIVVQTSKDEFQIVMNDEELNAFMIIVVGLNDPAIDNVAQAISQILTHCTDRCYSTVKEPMPHGS